MKAFLFQFGRVLLTAITVTAAAVIVWQLWVFYMDEPWTRDGRVRADIVGVAPDVSGLVTDVLVRDNQQVHAGDVLFRIDTARFGLALQQAQAAVASRQARLDEANRQLTRDRQLGRLSVVPQQKLDQSGAAAEEAAAELQQAIANLGVAKLNLARSEVKASVNGIVTNFDLRPGDYVSAGKPVAALVDTDSFHVDGYFEETKLPRIAVGDPVSIHVMGESAALTGHVESIAAGIADRERNASPTLLANVNPTFSWVRLAQRVPVRIALDHVPPQVKLLAGRTATVVVEPPKDAPTMVRR